MTMFKRFAGMKSAALALAAAAAMAFFPMAAEAHIYSIIPTSDTEVGEEHEVISSLTMHPLETQYSMYFMKIATEDLGLVGTLVYNDGTSSEEFVFEDYNNPDTTYVEELYEGNPDKYEYLTETDEFYDGYKAFAEIEKEGTVIVESGMNISGMIFYSKNIINLTADGGSMQEVGNGEWEEIVPLTDLAEATIGEPIEFKIIRNGEALADRTITYSNEDSESEYVEGEKSYTNLTELATSDEDGIFSYTPTTYGVHALVADMSRGDSGYYATTLTFTLAEPTEEEEEEEEEEQTEEETTTTASNSKTGSGGGCNAGFGGLALAALALVAMMKKRG